MVIRPDHDEVQRSPARLDPETAPGAGFAPIRRVAPYGVPPNQLLPMEVLAACHFPVTPSRVAQSLMEMNAGRIYGHFTPAVLYTLLSPEQGNLVELLDCYRGWSGLQMYEQIVEREIWRREDWDRTGQQCSGRTLEVRKDKSARVEISCSTVDGGVKATYTAEVKVRAQVHTLNNSYTDTYFYIKQV